MKLLSTLSVPTTRRRRKRRPQLTLRRQAAGVDLVVDLGAETWLRTITSRAELLADVDRFAAAIWGSAS
jgi:hypothetical protein